MECSSKAVLLGEPHDGHRCDDVCDDDLDHPGHGIRPTARPRRCGSVLKAVLLACFFAILIAAFLADPSAVKARMPSQLTLLADSLSFSSFGPSDPLLPSGSRSSFDPDDDSLTQDNVVVEGGDWAQTLFASLNPSCASASDGAPLASLTRMYDGPRLPKTAFASFPRSGNSYIRSLVERATGFRTSSTYCDHSLKTTFLGECERGPASNFFKKTHYPALAGRQKPKAEVHAMNFDRAVQVVRNPIDALYSYWTFEELKRQKLRNIQNKHTMHLNVTLGETDLQREQVLQLVDRWNLFHDVWSETPMPKLRLRYEDLRADPLAPLLQLVTFLLPPSLLPPLSNIACALTLDETKQAYRSSKSPPFTSWEMYTPELREEIINKTQRWWCEFGYDVSLWQSKGVVGSVHCSRFVKAKLKASNEL